MTKNISVLFSYTCTSKLIWVIWLFFSSFLKSEIFFPLQWSCLGLIPCSCDGPSDFKMWNSKTSLDHDGPSLELRLQCGSPRLVGCSFWVSIGLLSFRRFWSLFPDRCQTVLWCHKDQFCSLFWWTSRGNEKEWSMDQNNEACEWAQSSFVMSQYVVQHLLRQFKHRNLMRLKAVYCVWTEVPSFVDILLIFPGNFSVPIT